MSGLGSIRDVLRAGSRSRAVWVFTAIWVMAFAILSTVRGFQSFALFYNLGLLVFVILTLALTEAAPLDPPLTERREHVRNGVQLAFILLIVVITGLGGMAFHKLIAPVPIPLWTPASEAIGTLSEQIFGSRFLVNPFQYFVVPLIVLLLLGARLPELGFRRGHRVWWVMVLWCAIPLALIGYAILSGGATIQMIARSIFSNSMNNGFFEEFLMRGGLQTRLRKWLQPSWAILISSLIFGVWHLGLGYTNTGAVLPALASTIVFQACLGVAFGVIFERTRNLIAPSVVHVVLNVVGSMLG